MPTVLDRRQALALVAGAVASPVVQAAGAEKGRAEGRFVAVGYGGRRLRAADGLTWDADTEWAADGGDDTNCLFSVAFGRGKFVAVGGGAGKGHVLVTADGKDWREVRTTKTRVVPVVFGNGRFVVGTGRDFEYSADGETWRTGGHIEFPGGLFFRRAAFGNGVFVFCGDCDGKLKPTPRDGWRAVTADGAKVEAFESGIPNTRSVAFGAGRFVMVGEKGFRQSSADGVNWESAHDPADDFHWVYWAGDRFLLNGNDACYASADGRKWAKAGPRVPADPLAFGNGRYVGANWKTNLWASADGLAWKKTQDRGTNAVTAMAYGVS